MGLFDRFKKKQQVKKAEALQIRVRQNREGQKSIEYGDFGGNNIIQGVLIAETLNVHDNRDDVEKAQDEQVSDTPDDTVSENYSYTSPEYHNPVTEVYQPSYDPTPSSYDSGSSSYDGGSSYSDSGSY